jgi:nicotinamide-nucleotide amidase
MKTVEHILNALRTSGKTVCAAESITGGQIQAMLTSVSGASDIFKGGITAYRRTVKVDLLGVDDALARKTDCVDEEIARQMATGALKLFASDYAIATCGYAETNESLPYAFYAIAACSGILHSERVNLSGTRVEAQKQAAQLALNRLEELVAVCS